MSGAREIDVDELFERNADTRLLDRRRRDELGLPPVATPASAAPARFGPESMLGGDGVPLATPRGAMLRVSLQARPDRELIPGAVVTVVAEVADDGDADADDVRLRIAVPPEAEPIAGSFARDGVAIDGEALLGEGLRIGTVPAAGTIRLRFAVRVLPGAEPLGLVAHGEAPGVPAIAAPALRLTRRSGHAAYDAPRPFFELETGETDDDLATVAAAPPEPDRAVDTLIDEPAAPTVIDEPAATMVPAPAEPPEPSARDAESAPPEPAFPELELPPEPQPVPGLEPAQDPEPEPAFPELELPSEAAAPVPARTFVLARVLDADEVRALERVFSGAVPHGLAALALLSSVAAADAALGRALGVAEFARSISAALPRALVAARMNRPSPPVVTADALGALRPHADALDDDLAYDGPLLVTRMDARELDALRALLARALDDPFLRGVQVLLAVAPRGLDGVPEDIALRVRDALAAYRGAAGSWLMRVTVRRAVARGYDPLTAADPALHEAGRALVAALREALS
ncbi:MAG: hypothetical protein JWM87_3124 [Candidatus Eremiobacteraeota bacterium]|nr:hypothetical protein [Candidatus Eremiobacteraeota bacterium]